MVTLLVCLVVVVGAVASIVWVTLDDDPKPAMERLAHHRDRLVRSGRDGLARRRAALAAAQAARAERARASAEAEAAARAEVEAAMAAQPQPQPQADVTAQFPVFDPGPEPTRSEPATRPVAVATATRPGAPVARRPPVPPPSPLKRTARLLRGTVVLILLLATLGAVLAAVLAGAAGLVALGVRAAIG